MHALIQNGSVKTYPYSEGQLRADNPQVSYPQLMSDAVLQSFGVHPVASTTRPASDHTKNVTEGAPVAVGGVWTQVWAVTQATSAEITLRAEQAAEDVRAARKQLLADSDWTQVADAPVDKTVWATYRQELRDITTQAGFPHNITWPQQP